MSSFDAENMETTRTVARGLRRAAARNTVFRTEDGVPVTDACIHSTNAKYPETTRKARDLCRAVARNAATRIEGLALAIGAPWAKLVGVAVADSARGSRAEASMFPGIAGQLLQHRRLGGHCVDASAADVLAATGGQAPNCSEMVTMCNNATHGEGFQLLCPVTCNACPTPADGQCTDVQAAGVAATTWGAFSSCSALSVYCTDPAQASVLGMMCPVTCNACPTAVPPIPAPAPCIDASAADVFTGTGGLAPNCAVMATMCSDATYGEGIRTL